MKKLIISLILCLTASASGFTGMKPILGEQVDWSHPLSKGLVGLWLMNECTGIPNDIVGGTTLSTTGSPTWISGIHGSAVQFAGGTYYSAADASTPALDRAFNQITLLSYFKADVNPSNDGLLGKGTIWYLAAMDTDWVRLRHLGCGDGDTLVQMTAPFSFSDGEWHLLVATYDGANTAVYVDGIYYGGEAATGTMGTNNSDFAIGDIAAGEGWSWAHKQSMAAIWNRALSASEITRLYQEPFRFMAADDVIMKYVDAGEPPETTSQVIMIQMGAATLGMILAAVSIIFLNRRAA